MKHLHFILHILRRVWRFDPQTQSPAILLWPDPRGRELWNHLLRRNLHSKRAAWMANWEAKLRGSKKMKKLERHFFFPTLSKRAVSGLVRWSIKGASARKNWRRARWTAKLSSNEHWHGCQVFSCQHVSASLLSGCQQLFKDLCLFMVPLIVPSVLVSLLFCFLLIYLSFLFPCGVRKRIAGLTFGWKLVDDVFLSMLI